jgi:hypothetical protein
MNNRKITSRCVFAAFLLFVFSMANIALGQAALERLENQIRQRVGQDPQTPPSAPLLEPATGPVLSVEEPGYLGVKADDRQDRGRGVRLIGIDANGPAAKGGLKKNDLITAVSGVRIRQLTEMSDVMNLYLVGESVEFEILRDNKPQKLKVTLGRRPPQNASGPATETIPQGEVIPHGPITLEGPSLDMPQEPLDNPTPPAASPTRLTIKGDAPTLEQLQKRIEQLEKRVADLEKALEEAKSK